MLQPVPAYQAAETGHMKAASRELAAGGNDGATRALEILASSVARGVERGYLVESRPDRTVDTVPAVS
jgi:hypothetical protein